MRIIETSILLLSINLTSDTNGHEQLVIVDHAQDRFMQIIKKADSNPMTVLKFTAQFTFGLETGPAASKSN